MLKRYLYVLFFIGFLVEGFIFLDIYKKRTGAVVLGETIEASPDPTQSPTPTGTPTESPSPTTKPTPKETPSPTSTPTPATTPVPQPAFTSEQINGFIERFSAQYGVSPDILRHLALCESGFRYDAVNLSYYGLYQFGPTTWKNIRKEMGEDTNIDLRTNAEEAVQTAAYVLHVNKAYIWPNCTP